MKLSARAILTVVLVVAMLGSGVAFAAGVNFSPRPRICLGNLFGYGDVCGTAAKIKHHKKKKHVKKHHAKKHHAKKHHVKGTTVTRGPGFTG